MSKLRIITLYKLCPVQAQAVQENAKRPRVGCNIQLIKILKKSLVPNSCYIEIWYSLENLPLQTFWVRFPIKKYK